MSVRSVNRPEARILLREMQIRYTVKSTRACDVLWAVRLIRKKGSRVPRANRVRFVITDQLVNGTEMRSVDLPIILSRTL